MRKINKKSLNTFIVALLLAIFLFASGLSIYGLHEYMGWLGVKRAIAVGGYAFTCGVPTKPIVTPGCAETQSGCTCTLCNALCVGSTQLQYTGQPVCGMGISYACVGPMARIMGDMPLISTQQLILAGTSNLLSSPNDIVATQSLAAYRTEKVLDMFRFIIAGFKD